MSSPGAGLRPRRRGPPCTRGSPGPARGARPSAARCRAACWCAAGTTRGRRRAPRAARRSPATGSAARSRRRGPQGGPAFSIASRWSSTISTIRGSSRRIRRTVNSGVSIRRRRVCSGGSTPSRLPARIRSRSSALSFGAPGASKARRLSLLNRALSASTALTSACRATRNAGIPKAVSTCRTPSSSRSAAISRTGSKPSRRMCSGMVGAWVMQKSFPRVRFRRYAGGTDPPSERTEQDMRARCGAHVPSR